MCLLLLFSGGLVTQAAAAAKSDLPPLTSIDEFYRLSSEEIASGRPLQFRGTIVYFDPAWDQLHLYDGRLTQYLFPWREIPKTLMRGQSIEITARSALADGQYRLTNGSVRILGRGSLPAPARVSLANLTSNANQLVEVIGRVRGVNTRTGRAMLNLVDTQHRCAVYVMDHPLDSTLRQWIGRLVRVRGINASRTDAGGWTGMLFATTTNDLSVLQSPEQTPAEQLAVPIRSLLRSDLKRTANDLVRVQGLVSSIRNNESFTIRDSTGSLQVRTDMDEELAMDQRLDVWGYPELVGTQLVLADAFYDLAGAAGLMSAWTPPKEPVVADRTLPTLRSTREIRGLSRQEALRHYPVELEAVVTYADPEYGGGFLQDDTGGVYVVLAATNQLAPGQFVKMTGYTDTENFTPFVIQPAFTQLGMTNLPASLSVRLTDLLTSRHDCEWVQLEGVIHGFVESTGHLRMDLETPSGRFRALVLGVSAETVPHHLLDARIQLTGACGADLNAKGRLAGIVIHCPSLDHVREIDRPAADPFSLPLTPLGALTDRAGPSIGEHRIHVSGTVTYVAPDRYLILQDTSGVARVWASLTNQVEVGQTLEVVAWPVPGDFAPELREGMARITGRASSPTPVPVTASQILLYGTNDANLVQIEARLWERTRSIGDYEMLLQDGPNTYFEAAFPPGDSVKLPSQLKPGAVVRLTGICAIQGDQRRDPRSFQILLRSPVDITVLKSAPWWSPQYARIGLGVALLVLGLGTAWVFLLHRQVARHTETIRQRLASEAALERRYQNLVENAAEGIFQRNAQGHYLSINPALARIFGYASAGEALASGKNLLDGCFVDPQRQAQYEQELKDQGAVVDFQSEVYRRDGTRIWIAETSHAVRDDRGRLQYYEGAVVDITERKRAEELLRRSEERFAKAFRSSPMSVSITTLAEGRYWDANESFLRLVGYSREELIGHTSLELGIWAEPGDRQRMAEQLQTRSTVRELEMRLKTKQGQIRNTLGALEIIELESQPCVLGIIQDVTERLQLEAQFRQAQKMESVGRLAAGVAHDFNNLLTVIQGYTALLQSSGCSPTEAADSVKQVADAARRAANLTHQLLAFSRRQVMRQEQTNLNDLLHNLAQMLRPLLGEDITVLVDPTPTLPLISADTGMLEQVIMNLALNARDAMPKGGRLTLRTYLSRIDEEQARKNPEANPGEFVCLSVTDTGCGMDAATLAHVFEPFFTTKEVGKGSGLGLAMVFGIVKQHKGWVEVTSQVGAGSTFTAYFPAFTGARAIIAHPRPQESTMVSGKGNILLVEDEPALRRLARRVLERNGYRIISAASGIEALKEWDKQRKNIDLLVTDMVMPGGMSGRDLALRLQAETANLKVLYTSGYSAEMVGSGFLLKEGINFLPKPYSPATLTTAVKDCLDTALPC